MSFCFCVFFFLFEDETIAVSFLPFFAFLISKWAELQLAQNCCGEEERADSKDGVTEVNKKEELKECGERGKRRRRRW